MTYNLPIGYDAEIPYDTVLGSASGTTSSVATVSGFRGIFGSASGVITSTGTASGSGASITDPNLHSYSLRSTPVTEYRMGRVHGIILSDGDVSGVVGYTGSVQPITFRSAGRVLGSIAATGRLKSTLRVTGAVSAVARSRDSYDEDALILLGLM